MPLAYRIFAVGCPALQAMIQNKVSFLLFHILSINGLKLLISLFRFG